ncbi:ommochrome-binding protein-like [Cydia pomonella]|uniref:ommochrome-binding protein-like n=1 Tax=Cydia pomonella TaxID=82600 RepID=UPI002ADDB194|nr:ommochrome-binding protein-like [Cydia pomonella]
MLVVMNTRIQTLIMKLVILISSLVIVQAGVTKRDTQCEGPLVNGVQHSKGILKTDLDRPYLLTTDFSSNTLYFSYTIKGEEEGFKSAKLNLNTKEFSDIDGVPNGFAQAVDESTHEVYIGGSDGIYKYKPNANKADFFGANGTDIWTIYYKDVLYFSIFPSQFLYTFDNGEITRFKDLEDTLVDSFLIDDENTLFFSNSSGLYSQKKGTKDAINISGEDIRIRGLTKNKDGDVYVCVQDGIYSVNKTHHYLGKYVDIDDAFGVAFDNQNNLVYADATNVVRLTPCK